MAAASVVYAVIPVFNRLRFTRDCIACLKQQSYPDLKIVVSDGGSTDGTVEAVKAEFPDVVVLTTLTELWWTGSMAAGIEYALAHSAGDDGFVLMMNNDTLVSPDYVKTLVRQSRQHGAAVGALIVDSRNPEQILDAGEFVDWQNYTFPVRNQIGADEIYFDEIDVLPGRGSIVPLHMIRKAGNVDAKNFPHYLADYEFYTRLKRNGFPLGVSYEAKVLSHIEETGIIPTAGPTGLREIWRQTFSRRSMNNVVDHWRFVSRHAPGSVRTRLQLRLILRIVADFGLRTQLRPLFLPLYWLLTAPFRLLSAVKGQVRITQRFVAAAKAEGPTVLCRPSEFPGIFRWPLYLVASPGPLRTKDIIGRGHSPAELCRRGILSPMSAPDWFSFSSLRFENMPDRPSLRRLFVGAWNPIRKLGATVACRRDMNAAIRP